MARRGGAGRNERAPAVRSAAFPDRSGGELNEESRVGDDLRQPTEILNTLLQASALAITVLDRSRRLRLWSPAAERLFGWSAEEVLGKPLPTIPREGKREFEQAITESLAGAEHAGIERRRRRKDGTLVDVVLWTAPLRNAVGEVIGSMGLFADASGRKRAERALRESEVRYRTLVDHFPNGSVVMLDRDLRFTLAGGQILSQVGLASEDMLGRTIFEVFPPGTVALLEPRLRAALEGVSSVFEVPFGGRIHEVRTIPLRDESGRVTASMGVTLDITARRETERDLAAYQEKLRGLAAEVVAAEERERRRIAAAIHDQLSQVLAVAKIRVGVARRAALKPEVKEALRDTLTLLDRAIDATRSLTFELSPPVLHEVGFEAAVEWLGERLQQQHGIVFRFDSVGPALTLQGEVRSFLFRAVQELLVNVIKHAGASRVDVKLWSEDGSLAVRVEDDGASAHIPARPPAARKRQGYGLFSIRERLGHFGGRLEVERRPGGGTRVTIFVPVARGVRETGEET